MKKFLKDAIDFDKSIISMYIEEYNYPWEVLDDLNCLIIKIGKITNNIIEKIVTNILNFLFFITFLP